MTKCRRTDFDPVDAEASLEHVLVSGVVFGAGIMRRHPKSACGPSIDGGASSSGLVRRIGGRWGVGFGSLAGLGKQDPKPSERGEEEREHAAGVPGGNARMPGMGERSGDGLEALVGGNDLPDVVSTGAELNERHGHGGRGSLRSGWHPRGRAMVS